MRDASAAVAEFLKRGGKIVKGRKTVPATGPEVVDYLLSCGVSAKYSPGATKSYVYEGKRYSLTNFIELANIHREARQLSPFAVKLNLSVLGRTPST